MEQIVRNLTTTSTTSDKLSEMTTSTMSNSNETSYQYVISVSQVSFLIVMTTLIITLNITVLLVHRFTPALRMPMSVFLKSLAYADLWVGVNCGLNIGVTFSGGWPYGLAACKVIGYLLLVVILVSIMSLTCISLERYTAIKWPIQYRSRISYRRSSICVIVLWLSSGVIFMPAFFDWGMDVDVAGSCVLFWRYNITFGFFLISLLIIPNLLISMVCYITILHTLVARQRWIATTRSTRSSNQQSDADQRRQEKLLARVGMGVLSAFYITWLPYVACSFLRFLDLVDIPSGLYNGTLYLGISNSFLNCIIYSISHKAFREGFKQMVKTFCNTLCCKRRTERAITSQRRNSPCTIRCSPSSGTNTSIQLTKTKALDI